MASWIIKAACLANVAGGIICALTSHRWGYHGSCGEREAGDCRD
jgi:hypothetical protein